MYIYMYIYIYIYYGFGLRADKDYVQGFISSGFRLR